MKKKKKIKKKKIVKNNLVYIIFYFFRKIEQNEIVVYRNHDFRPSVQNPDFIKRILSELIL